MEDYSHLENRLSNISAGFWKRFLSGTLDILFLLLVNTPVFLLLHSSLGNYSWTTPWKMTPNNWITFVFLLYFSAFSGIVLLVCPVLYSSQTIFSRAFGICAISLSGKKLKCINFFKTYFAPFFLVLFYHVFIFSLLSTDRVTASVFKLLDNNSTEAPERILIYLVKATYILIIFVQLHYFFTVAINKRKINWYTKESDIVWVDIKKAKMFGWLHYDPFDPKNKDLGTEKNENSSEGDNNEVETENDTLENQDVSLPGSDTN